MAPVSSIRNLGPAMEAAFSGAGIDSAETLRSLGADSAYARLIESGHRPHFMAYLALVTGLQGRPLGECTGAEKAALRARFDALRSAGPHPGTAFERHLDALGVRPPRRPSV
ncbi:TfoX/Sxy family DNA transformation protein [Histidinibacterium lentulum]|uniref:Competence protein TfoX n=1 Tax=Histidinibacterium lentulum TaxID=2480588 RepID=A0A3N2QTC1_9RHOB|nr:TfoX/Sxy family DNA transformation protein [Histidinibacterium lentulum]ROT98444.1 competence protein TfoX [Histidinibacterium lentulum]